MTLREIASCFEQRFGKGKLPAASQFEFSSMTRETNEILEQWQIELLKPRIVLLGREYRQVLQEQTFQRFAMGCRDICAGWRLIDSPLLSFIERRIKTYQLSRRSLTPRR